LTVKKTGTIEALNVSPKGFYEGFLLRTGKTIVQVNLPKDEPGMLYQGIELGKRITAEVKAEQTHGEPAHGVFRLVRLTSANGHSSKAKRHPFSGRIARLNYALHGEVNGGILVSGDFLHLTPEGARALKLKLGMQVQGLGHTKAMIGGHLVIEAEKVNGIEVQRHKANMHAAKHRKP
jgi:hypothetical protein